MTFSVKTVNSIFKLGSAIRLRFLRRGYHTALRIKNWVDRVLGTLKDLVP